jgi:nitrogen regulatory protein PII
MSRRNLQNWLDGYAEYTSQTESPRRFNKWSGIAALAAALRKKVKFQLGRLSTYPNLYVVLVAEPGVARKTQALSYATDLTYKVDSILHSADSTTRESLIEDLENAKQEQSMADGGILLHNSLSIISREFESFLGQKKENARMLVLLTDLFDCGDRPWEYKTKNKGKNILNAVFLNLLAATTPESLASSLPSSAIGGGLTSRILFVWATEKTKKFAIPPRPSEVLVKALVQDLEAISRIAGVYEFSPECEANWITWYETYDNESIYRICKDRAFSGWYSRKSVFVLKLAQILTAAKTNSMVIEWNTVQEALELLEEIERDMDKAFTAVGRSDITVDVTAVCSIIEKYESIHEKQLLHLVYRDMDANKFDNVMATAIRCGSVTKEIVDGKIFYKPIRRCE